MSNILGVITARGGSKGIPRKNVRLLGNVPLIAYTISVAKRSKMIDRLIVSTDDSEIIAVSEKYDVEVPFVRPAHLATDRSTHVAVLQHAVIFMEKKTGTTFDNIVILQPTSPFRLIEDIDETVRKIIDLEADSAVSVCEIQENHPLKAKKITNGYLTPFSSEYIEPNNVRRQDLPVAYKRSGAVYVVNRDILMAKNSLFGDKIATHIVPVDRSIDIDNELDWVKAEYMLNNLKNQGFIFT